MLVEQEVILIYIDYTIPIFVIRVKPSVLLVEEEKRSRMIGVSVLAIEDELTA